MKKKRIIIVGVIILAVLLTVVLAATRSLSYMMSVELRGVDPASFDNGSYTGTFEHGRFTNTLTVNIENERIVRISVDNDVFGASVMNVSDEVFSRVIEIQDTRIDAIAGATVTTNAYLMAIENTLGDN